MSLLLKVDDDATESPFWGWIDHVNDDTFTFDLNTIMPKTFALTNSFVGYYGSSTMPDCLGTCWSIGIEPIPISQATLDKMKALNNNVANNRNIQTSGVALVAVSSALYPQTTDDL